MSEVRHDTATQYIDAHAEHFLSALQALVRHPSDSTSGEGIRECAGFLADRMDDLGLNAELLETEGNPLVFGAWEQRAELPTLLITTHYDVQPAAPLDAWRHPPYEAVREGDHIWGRGTSDAKGPVTAVLSAVEAVMRSGSRPSVNLKVLLDGEEEIGSPSMPGAIARYQELIQADAVVTFDGNSMADGRPVINFGGGGLLYLQLDVETARNDIHANRGALVPNAAWRLAWALSSLKAPDEQITIDRFAENLVATNALDRELLQSHQWDDTLELESMGAFSFLPGRGGERGPESLHLLPIVGISGIHSGYSGGGVGAVLPASACAKVYIGLRANQTPDEIVSKIRNHLDRRNFDDIRLTVLGSTEPSFHRADSALASMVIDVAEKLYGRPPVVYPRGHWYGRQGSWIGSHIGANASQIAMIAPPQPNNHGSNEYMLVDYLLRGVNFISRLSRWP